MTKPSRLLEKLAQHCFSTDGQAATAFLEAVTAPRERTSALVWLTPRPSEEPFPILPPLDWQPDFVDRVPAESKPGQHELHDVGAFYIMDFSSVFAASAVRTVATLDQRRPHRMLDVCSAPGGKAIFAVRALNPHQIICNEVTRKRCKALISNLTRCQIANTSVVSVDPAPLAEALEGSVSLAIVDAPCSGQSLLVKGKPAPGCFHPRTITMNLRRQRRILAETSKAISPGGFVAYMTCTYSPEENEEVMEWFVERFPEFSPVEVPALRHFRTHLSELPAYRLWPQSTLGAGSFVALFKRGESDDPRNADGEPLPETLRPLWVSRNALREAQS